MVFNSHSQAVSFLLQLSLFFMIAFLFFFYSAFCLINSQFCSYVHPLWCFCPCSFPNTRPPHSACKIQLLPQPLPALAPFWSLQLNSLPPKRSQIIKVELHLAKTTSDLRGVIWPFKNNQELFNFLVKSLLPLLHNHRAPNCSEIFQYDRTFWKVSACICTTVHDISHALLPVQKAGDCQVRCWPTEPPVPLFWLPRACNQIHFEALENEHNKCKKQNLKVGFFFYSQFKTQQRELSFVHFTCSSLLRAQ